jgi:hypothetical protein
MRRSGSLVVVVLVLIGLAIADVAWYLVNQPPPVDGSITDLIDYVFELMPAVVAILLPAVLLIRHPDAARRAPILLFGTLLYAAVQGLVILNAQLEDIFATLTPPDADLPFLVPSATVFNVFLSLVTAFGVGYLAVGLANARQNEDVGRWVGAVTAALVPVATVFATIVGIVAVAQIDLGDTPMSPTLFLYLATSVVLGIIRMAVWAYLLAVATRGAAALEGPRLGWGLAAVAAGLVIVALALVNLGGVISLADPSVNSVYGYAIVLAYGLGHIALFAAFAIGLPALGEGESEVEDVRTPTGRARSRRRRAPGASGPVRR